MFGTKESRVILLNKAAPSFTRLIQDSLWENVLLHIARLTDTPATSGKQNLTIKRLPALIGRQETRVRVEDLVTTSLSACKFARDWRNRHIAHSDLDRYISNSAKPLEFSSRQKVNDALQTFVDVLNAVSEKYLESTSSFDPGDGDAIGLLYVIDDGLVAAKARRERLKGGQYDPTDLGPKNL